MFLFSLAPWPLLLGFGLVSSLLSAKFNAAMLKASGVLVLLLGLVMFTRASACSHRPSALQPAAASGAGIAVARLVTTAAGGSDQGGVRAVLPAGRPGGGARALDPQVTATI